MNLKPVIIAALLGCSLQSCFTGIESTPRIGAGELRRQHVSVTPEQEFLAGVTLQRPAEWKPGKEFRVTDSKISLIFTSASTGTDSLAGGTIRFCRFDSVPAVDSHAAVEALFVHATDTLRYRPGFDYAALNSRERLDIPFAIDLDLVSEVRSILAGNTYYVTTPLWYYPENMQALDGLRHVPVQVTDVRPGTAAMPLFVIFRCNAEGAPTGERGVLMTIGTDRISTRNFDTLFTFTDPRKRYPAIRDDIWQLIVRSKVAEGMTRDECRLALGSPLQIIHGGGTAATLERWSYPDGVYLIFDDGLLSSFRL